MKTIPELIAEGFTFAVNHSGGKDSQAMLIKLLDVIPRDQLIVIHATLGEHEWDGAMEHAEKQAKDAGLPFIVAKAVDGDGNEKTFFDMVEHRFATRPEVPCWPSAGARQCTSDLKRGPITRELRRWLKQNGKTKIVNCMGIRAAEGTERAKKVPFKYHVNNSKAGREWYEWLPIFELSTAEVFKTIKDAGQEPHWAYADGNERLSCVFCIYGSHNDLAHGAKLRPDLFAKYCELEERTGYTMHMSQKPLKQLVEEAAEWGTEVCDEKVICC